MTGFYWNSGSTRATTGIIIWNDVFLYSEEAGRKIGIIVIDTQGLFDSKTLPVEDSSIFTLGTLISSIQVVNLFGVVQENQLDFFRYAIESAKFILGKNHKQNGKPFQKLMFLIRDWVN